MRLYTTASLVLLITTATAAAPGTRRYLKPTKATTTPSQEEVEEVDCSRTPDVPNDLLTHKECFTSMIKFEALSNTTADTEVQAWVDEMCGNKYCAKAWDQYMAATAKFDAKCGWDNELPTDPGVSKGSGGKGRLLFTSRLGLGGASRLHVWNWAVQEEKGGASTSTSKKKKGEKKGAAAGGGGNGTMGFSGGDISQAAPFFPVALGCKVDPEDNKYCAAKKVDTTLKSCDFYNSCCLGLGIEVVADQLTPGDLNAIKTKCPHAEQAVKKKCKATGA